MQGFYLIWNPVTGYTKYRHNTFDSAKNEAARMAKQNDGQEFFVLSAIARAISETVRFDTLSTDEIPF